MQKYIQQQNIHLSPHGKTTMSPKLFNLQLQHGAWGITFANMKQLLLAIEKCDSSLLKRAIIANQIIEHTDLQILDDIQEMYPDLRILFLVDSKEQVDIIRKYKTRNYFQCLLEVGYSGGRTGCRSKDAALSLAEYINQSPTLRLCGIETYEGLQATCNTKQDVEFVNKLMLNVFEIFKLITGQGLLFSVSIHHPIILTAGGSSIFDLVTPHLQEMISWYKSKCNDNNIIGILRSGCYITGDDVMYSNFYKEMKKRESPHKQQQLPQIQSCLEVWGTITSLPEPGLAIIGLGKRDVGYDAHLPKPIKIWKRSTEEIIHINNNTTADDHDQQNWKIIRLNDQHAYMTFNNNVSVLPAVGDRIGCGISHPCTTFDKWQHILIVDDLYQVVDVIDTYF